MSLQSFFRLGWSRDRGWYGFDWWCCERWATERGWYVVPVDGGHFRDGHWRWPGKTIFDPCNCYQCRRVRNTDARLV